MSYLIIDTETTGFNKTTDSIVQLSYIVCDNNFNDIDVYDWIIQTDTNIGNSHIHGITNELSAKGVPKEIVFTQLKNSLDQYPTITIVGHNLSFDMGFIIANTDYQINNKQYCTMKESTSICKIPGRYGRYKWPSLKELYDFLYDEPFNGVYHNSLDDVIATKKCMMKLLLNGHEI